MKFTIVRFQHIEASLYSFAIWAPLITNNDIISPVKKMRFNHTLKFLFPLFQEFRAFKT